MTAARRKMLILGLFFGWLLVVNVPVMLLRTWRAAENPGRYSEAWPYWFSAAWVNAAAGAVGLLWLWRGVRLERQALRARRGQCPQCGYDLTGNVSGVCPECGTAARRRRRRISAAQTQDS